MNFILEDVEASSEEEAIKIARERCEKDGLEGFTITANNEEVTSLEGIFDAASEWPRATAY